MEMKAFLIFFLLSLEPMDVNIPRVMDVIDEKNIQKFLNKGTIVIVHKKESPSHPQFISAGTIINASRDEVWKVITDYEKYPEFVPQVEKVVIKSREEKELAVEYHLLFTFTIIKLKVKYVLLVRLNPPEDIWWTLKKDEKNDLKEAMGRWELFPLEEKKTAAFYTIYSDVQSMGRLMNFFLKQQPQLELAVPVSTGALMVEAVKKKIKKIP